MSGAGSYAEAASYRLRAHEGGGGAIVLLHGLGGDLDQLWGATDGEVGGRPVPVLAADARAHGQTQRAELGRLNFEVLAQDVTSLVDRLQLGPKLVLVGVSMGRGHGSGPGPQRAAAGARLGAGAPRLA